MHWGKVGLGMLWVLLAMVIVMGMGMGPRAGARRAMMQKPMLQSKSVIEGDTRPGPK